MTEFFINSNARLGSCNPPMDGIQTPQVFAWHKDGCVPLQGEVWVFGSNMAGRHGAGAALVAREHFGAKNGLGMGYQGPSPGSEPPRHCYGIPTKDSRLVTLPLDVIAACVANFIDFAHRKSHLRFFITRVGCGLAGYQNDQVAPLFAQAPWDRCSFPEAWKPYLEPLMMAHHNDGCADRINPSSSTRPHHA